MVDIPRPRHIHNKWKTLLLTMKIGDSHVCNNATEKEGMKRAAKRLGYKIISRKMDDLPRQEASYRVWRTV